MKNGKRRRGDEGGGGAGTVTIIESEIMHSPPGATCGIIRREEQQDEQCQDYLGSGMTKAEYHKWMSDIIRRSVAGCLGTDKWKF